MKRLTTDAPDGDVETVLNFVFSQDGWAHIRHDGTGGDILPKVDMVSDNFALGHGYCYAGSGQLPIGAGQPAVRITEMTVGGKDL